jgi:hypothetical protein
MIRQLLRNTLLYKSLNVARVRLMGWNTIRTWQRRGCPLPPPPELKHDTILEYGKRFGVEVLIETGTFMGDTLEAAKRQFAQLYSIELSPELHGRVKQRFAADHNIHLFQGDSAEILKKILPVVRGRSLFWLDAHYSGGVTARGASDTPIIQELDAVLAFSHTCVVLIDDARLFDGTNSYPTLNELQRYLDQRAPGWIFDVKDDIIRLYQPKQ